MPPIEPVVFGVLFVLAAWNVFIATRMETPYPETMVELYALPFTRLILLLLVVFLSLWDVRVGLMAALAFVCLGADVIFLTK